MSTNLANKSPYLITSRKFSLDPQQLSVQLNKSYIDTANAVNLRTIGLFVSGSSIVTGNVWYTKGGNQKQQTLRQVYTFTAAGNIAHGINFNHIAGFVQIYGTLQDSSENWYPLPLVDATDVTKQISLSVTSSNIVITAGAAAVTIASGFVVLEWLSNT